MITKYTKLIALNIVIFFIFQYTFADTVIFPKKKPFLSSEALEKKISKNTLIPLKKPSLIKKKEITKNEKIIKKKTA